jgi:hypothetical protein
MSKTDTLLKVGAGAAAVAYLTDMSLPSLPEWTPLAGVAVLVGGAAAHVAAGKILDLLPEDDDWDVYLHEVRKDDGGYIASWGMTQDFWEQCTVNRQLNPVEDRGPGHYECYRFDPSPDWWDNDRDGGVVWGTWRGQDPDSVIVGNITLQDAWDEIREMRDGLEDDAAAARILINRYPSILRQMDRERAIKFVNMVGSDVSGDVEGRDVDDILRDELPEELVPRILLDEDYGRDDEQDDAPGDVTTAQAIGRLLDGEPNDDLGDDRGPAATTGTTDAAVATDGSGET